MKPGASALVFLLALAAACSSAKDNDQPAPLNPSPLGSGMRLRDVQDPSKNACNGAPCANLSVNVTSVVVTAIDTFDETQNGKSRGTVFVQDADVGGPFGGVSMYSPTYVPANLRLAPGDVIDLSGQYVEQTKIGSTVDFSTVGAFLPQMNKPQVTPSFEAPLPTPVVVQASDLESFATGRKWIGMLVTIQDVTVVGAPVATGSGRVAATVANVANGLSINNELWDLQAWNGSNTSNSFPAGTHFKSVTGIVDFFFNIFLAPRSAADLVQ